MIEIKPNGGLYEICCTCGKTIHICVEHGNKKVSLMEK